MHEAALRELLQSDQLEHEAAASFVLQSILAAVMKNVICENEFTLI